MSKLERAGYLAWAQNRSYQARLARTRDLLVAHADVPAAISWGKDSTVLAHLAAETPGRQLINARYPNPAERLADMDRVRDLVLARSDMEGVHYEERLIPGEWEMYKRAGGFFSSPTTPGQRSATRWWRRALDEGMRCGDSVLLGLRAGESRGRALRVACWGDDHTRRDGLRVILPLARWTGRDIWAYLVTHNLPWLRIYDVASCGRERARSGFVWATGAGETTRRHGVWRDWQAAYPSEFAAWLDRFPRLAAMRL